MRGGQCALFVAVTPDFSVHDEVGGVAMLVVRRVPWCSEDGDERTR